MNNDQFRHQQQAQNIIKLFLPYQRMQKTKECSHDNFIHCVKVHINKIVGFISKNEKIQFILPAFPAKSVNNNKTFGPKPDLGELLALKQLHHICEKIRKLYKPGAEIIICSDGRVFNDLVFVSDVNVKIYVESLKEIINQHDLFNINFFDLEDYYSLTDYQQMREHLEEEYADSLDKIKLDVKHNLTSKNLFNGIHRFVYEDQLNIFKQLSNNQIRNNSKATAYKVIQRSSAWGRLVVKQFPGAVRFSIHPQLCGSEKLGIMLLKSENVWATPWHRVVIHKDGDYSLIKKYDAEKIGAHPVFNRNEFSHYKIMEIAK